MIIKNRLAAAPLAAALALAGAGAATPSAASAAERPLIAPLDVQVTAEVRPTTVLKGQWDVSSEEGGMWDGDNITMTEAWLRGAKAPIRIRGKASGGPSRRHVIDAVYLRKRVGSGILTEASPTPVANPVQLICHAEGTLEQGGPAITSNRVTLQIIDQPSRNRVLVRGPGIPFFGPECTLSQPEPDEGQDIGARPWRRVGILPPDGSVAWRPLGARGSWQLPIPRAEFAAGGTFRFRGTYAVAAGLHEYSGTDVWGSGLMSGTVAIDLHVKRRGR